MAGVDKTGLKTAEINDGKNLKGTSVKILKQRSREKAREYKTRKKKHRTPKIDPKQSRIYEFYSRSTENNISVAGLNVDMSTQEDIKSSDSAI